MDLVEMSVADVDAVVDLVSVAMNADEGEWARETFAFHFGCCEHGLDDGRVYYLLRDGETVVGLAGLHRYIWGPRENVWLGWFAVHPDYHRRGLGRELIEGVCGRAREGGYRKFFVETYESEEFEKARGFYEGVGFVRAGGVDGYLPDDSAMVVYCRWL